jgi:hypothetical protein
MPTDRILILIPPPVGPARKTAGSLRISPTVKNDVFLEALLETPMTEQVRRSPLQWSIGRINR